MNKGELACLYFFHTLQGIGNRTLWKIKQEFGSFQACFEANGDRLSASTLTPAIRAIIAETRKYADPLAALERLGGQDTNICCVEDHDYPDMLRSIYDPPYLFYYRGRLEILDEFCISVVGSRVASNYGRVQARRFGNELARQGMAVVSGMARGIDTEAHLGALEAEGKTVAVLGSGLDVVYPPENRKLYERIGALGLVISEFPLHTRPEPGNFPARNRTISGLSRGVLVVEAQIRSGALITADFALEQGREVFAIPGPVNSKNSAGTNQLIKQGACLVTCIDDILEDFGLLDRPAARQGELSFELDPEESLFLENMGTEAVHFDVLTASTALSIGQLSTMLLKLELKGIIRAVPGNYYVKI